MKTAEERGMEMMHIPMGQLPPLALEFAEMLCKQVGKCGEVLLTAWITYAQCVEGLKCTDSLYKAGLSEFEWFNSRRDR